MHVEMVREAFGEALVDLGELYSNLVVFDADISASLKTGAFRKQYPQRHFNFGVAEQNMMMSAAGLATTGLIPVVCTYATFASMRACEQIRSMICYPKLNVKIIASHGGIEVGWDGPTHQATEDIAMMRSIPNMTVVVPADVVATEPLLRQSIEHDGPIYFRMGRNPVPVIYPESQQFFLGKGNLLKNGRQVLLVATGVMVATALQAAEELEHINISCSVMDIHTVKPFDEKMLLEQSSGKQLVVTLEDHNIIGGLGGAVAECLATRAAVPLIRIGLRDCFAESGDPKALFRKYQMDSQAVVQSVNQFLNQ